MQSLGPLDEPRLQSDILVVLLHGGFERSSVSAKQLSDVCGVVRRVLNSPDILAPQLPTHVFAFVDPVELAWRVVRMVDERVAQHEKSGTSIEHIVFIGYSFGGLLARMAYVLACGETPKERWIVRDAGGTLRPLFSANRPEFVPNRKWAGKIRRLVLLAGMNRGWTIDFRVSGLGRTAGFRALEKVVTWLERLRNLGRWISRRPRCAAFGFTSRRGGSFISALRWQWLHMRQSSFHDEEGRPLGNAPVVQLLGTKDDLVGPEDNIDLVTGQDFIYLEMPDCGHKTVIEMELASEKIPEESRNSRRFYRQLPPRQGRGELFGRALESLESDNFTDGIRGLSLRPQGDSWLSLQGTPRKSRAADLPAEAPGESQPGKGSTEAESKGKNPAGPAEATDIAFVIHGIRDLGYWTQKVAWRISEYGIQAGLNFALVTRSYGYFPMWPFLFPARRRQHVEWLVDQILEMKSRYPKATMHYCGHSNGTYLLARALEDHSFLRFQHVVFAGSVVRDKYPWREMIARGQVSGVVNYVATADLVVGWFPKLFQWLPFVRRLNDIGGGGFDGFADLSTLEGTEESFSKERPALQVAYVSGGHSAAIGENSWGDIAGAIVHGTVKQPARPLFQDKQIGWIAALSRKPIIVWIGLLLVLYCFLCFTLWICPFHFARGFASWIDSLKAWKKIFPWFQLFLVWCEWRIVRFIVLRL